MKFVIINMSKQGCFCVYVCIIIVVQDIYIDVYKFIKMSACHIVTDNLIRLIVKNIDYLLSDICYKTLSLH